MGLVLMHVTSRGIINVGHVAIILVNIVTLQFGQEQVPEYQKTAHIAYV
jgi:hypothetical protein